MKLTLGVSSAHRGDPGIAFILAKVFRRPAAELSNCWELPAD
jgi:hypothetical protein